MVYSDPSTCQDSTNHSESEPGLLGVKIVACTDQLSRKPPLDLYDRKCKVCYGPQRERAELRQIIFPCMERRSDKNFTLS